MSRPIPTPETAKPDFQPPGQGKQRSNAPGWFQAATSGNMREMTDDDIQAAIRPAAPRPPKPEPPPNRLVRHGREVDPVTGRYRNQTWLERKLAAAWDRLTGPEPERKVYAGDTSLLHARRPKPRRLARVVRRITWFWETGEWPTLCATRSCIGVVLQTGPLGPGGYQPFWVGHCDRHSLRHLWTEPLAEHVGVVSRYSDLNPFPNEAWMAGPDFETLGTQVRTVDIRFNPANPPDAIRVVVEADGTVTITARP